MNYNKDTRIGEILANDPKKIEILLEAGMHCIGCPASYGETIEEACMIHGIDAQDIVDELNEPDEDVDEQNYTEDNTEEIKEEIKEENNQEGNKNSNN